MTNYMVACQFKNKAPSTDFLQAIKHIDPGFDHPIDTIWYIQSHHTIDFIQQTLLSMIDLDEILIINTVSDQRDYNIEQSHQQTNSYEKTKSSLYSVFS